MECWHTAVYSETYVTCTLDALGEVPEVEDVVRLGRCGEKVSAHTSIDFHTGKPREKERKSNTVDSNL